MNEQCLCGNPKSPRLPVCTECFVTAPKEIKANLKHSTAFVQRERATNALLMHARKRGEKR